jgi:integral membrane protein
MNKSNPASSLLTAYRALAYVTGVGLVLLCAACVNAYLLDGSRTPVMIVGTLHGWLYMAYVVVAFVLGMKLEWPMGKIVWTVLAGTVPTAVFFVERRVVREMKAQLAAKESEQLVGA